jgi:hypothetical protein
MQNRSLAPASWLKVGLAILPGLFALATGSGLFRAALGEGIAGPIARGGLAAVCISVIIAASIVERRLAAWCFPALGILTILLSFWWWVPLANMLLPFVDPPFPFWQIARPVLELAAPGAIGALAVYRVRRRHGIHIPRLAWALLGLLILVGSANVIASTIADGSPYGWAALLQRLWLSVWRIGLILSPVAIGLSLAWRNGLSAGLMVAAFQYVMVDGLLECAMVDGRPTYGICVCTSSQLTAIVLSCLPALLFLLVSPIWVLRSRSVRSRSWGLILSPLVAVVSGEVIRAIVCRATPSEHWIGWWLTHMLSSAQYITPVALAAVMYHWIGRQGAAGNPRRDGGASRTGWR